MIQEKLEEDPTARKRYHELMNRVDKFAASILLLQDNLATAESSVEADVKQLNQLDQKVLTLTLTIEKYLRIIREQSTMYLTCPPSTDLD